MTYGYTVSDSANRSVFLDTFQFIIDKLHFAPIGEQREDIDRSLYQNFTKDGQTLFLESNVETDYVGILSDTELPITALHKWKQ